MFGYLTCYACGDTWCRDLIDLEVQAYIEANPELKDKILAGDITEVDLGEVLCDGCEDFYREEAALAELELEEADDLDDLDGNYASWLCATCGDPAYDCGCDDDEILDIEEEIDRKVELMENERL